MYDPTYQPSIGRVLSNPTDNEVSTRQTIELMRKLVFESLNDKGIKQICSAICSELNRPYLVDIIRSCYWWVKNHYQLRDDEGVLAEVFNIQPREDGSEVLISPAYAVRFPHGDIFGDCDDYSTLLATLIIGCGVPRGNVYFVTVAADPRDKNVYSHVYLAVRDWETGKVIPLDCSHGPYPEWEEERVWKKAYWVI